MFGMKKMQKQWAEHKAMESCFGENMMKTSLLKMKKAVVKCTGMDMPELDLPMYKSPHRFVHAMLDSHQDMEQMKVMGALKSMQQLSGQKQQPALQLVLGGQQQQVQKDDMFKKMMMKMMLKKMFNEDSSSSFGNMDSSSSDKFDMLKMLTQHMRSKRATDDIFELGDRLTEKLKSEQQKCKLNLAMPHAFSKSSILSTKTSKLMSTPWLNQSKRENGENSQTNGSRNTTSRTAAHAPLLPTPFPIWSSKTAHMVKNGEES